MVNTIIEKIKKIDQKLGIPNWLSFLFAGALILRIPSFFEPYSYGDEMIYLTLGEGVRRDLTLYRDIHDNKPPLIYFVAAIAKSLVWFKIILAFWMIVTIFLFWKLTTILFEKNTKLQKISTVIFALLTTLPLLEGNIVNSELFLIGPIIAGSIILLSNPNYKKIFLSGLLFSLATLFKVPAAFDLGAIVLFWIITSKLNGKGILEIIKKTAVLSLGFAIPILLTIIWYWVKGALNDYLVAAFLQNIGYLSSWRGKVQGSLLTRNSPLLVRGGLVLLGTVLLKIFNKKISPTFTFACLWLLTSLFATTLSERPYPHYLIQAVPAISLLAAMLIASTRVEQGLAIIPLFLAVLVPVYYKFYYYSTFNYYNRFIKFASQQIQKEEYFNEFDSHVVRNYKIASYIKTSAGPTDSIFVWGDSPPIYALTRKLPPLKYVATYHINDFSSKPAVISALTKNPPKFIVMLKEGEDFPALRSFLTSKYVVVNSGSDYEIWLRMNLPNP